MWPPQKVAGVRTETPSHPELAGQRVFLNGICDAAGEGIARAFASQRVRLVLHSRQEPARAADLADRLQPEAGELRLFSGDVGADQAAAERLARAALGAFGGIDLLINLVAAGANDHFSDQRDLEDRIADRLRPAMVLARAVADHARNSGRPATVMHVSLARSGARGKLAAYAMLKSGLEAMTQDQSRRWFSHDVCVHAFVPGLPEDDTAAPYETDNVVRTGSNFAASLNAILLNAAGGRSRWLNGITLAVPV